MTMTMIGIECPSCGRSLALLVRAPEPGSLADYFGQIELEALADSASVISADQPCPHCGCENLLIQVGQ
jgi:hypothetical protein